MPTYRFTCKDGHVQIVTADSYRDAYYSRPQHPVEVEVVELVPCPCPPARRETLDTTPSTFAGSITRTRCLDCSARYED